MIKMFLKWRPGQSEWADLMKYDIGIWSNLLGIDVDMLRMSNYQFHSTCGLS